MQRLIKTIYCENGELYGRMDGRRILLARCEPKIEIMEHSQKIPSIGVNGCNVKKRHVTIILCGSPETTREVDADFLRAVAEFELSADIQRQDGIFENVSLGNIAPTEIDLDGDWTFEVISQDELTKKLMAI